MKKILISRKDIVNINSGVPKKVLQEVKTFNELGYKSYVIAENINSELVKQYDSIPVKTFKWPFNGHYQRMFYAKRVEAWIYKYKPDLIIGHGDILVQDICYIHNCVHLAHERIHNKSLSTDDPVGRIHSTILSQQKFKLLICNSKKMQDDLCERFNINKQITSVIYPEFDDSKFTIDFQKQNRQNFRKMYSISDQTVVVGLITSGNLKKRNMSLLIEVAKLFKDRDVKFVVSGASKKDPYKILVNQYGLNDLFIFLPIIDNVEFYFHGIDIFVLPAIFEEFGRSTIEAMSLELPVILSSFVGSSEILEDKSSAFILNDFEVKTFYDKLDLLISNFELRKELGILNKKTSQKYNASIQNKKFFELLRAKELI